MAENKPVEAKLKFWEALALGALFIEAMALVAYGGATLSFLAAAVLFLLALASAASGGILGFIFGVPRYRSDASITGNFLHNSNLEQISDWLTKILVGATLVQLDRIGAAIGAVSREIGNQLGVSSGSTAACSVMVFSFFTGFMWGYLWISLRVRGEMDPKIPLPAPIDTAAPGGSATNE